MSKTNSRFIVSLKIVLLFKEVGDPNFLSRLRRNTCISVTEQSMEILVCYVNLIQGLY